MSDSPCSLPGAAQSGRQVPGLSRRRLFSLAGSAAAGTLLAACRPPGVAPSPSTTPVRGQGPAGGSGPARTASGKVQLVYQDWRTEWFPPMAQEMLAQFHESHPDIQVFYTLDPENLEEKMLGDMEAGTAPDVFAGCCDFFPIWAQKGHALDLRPYVEADLDKATIQDWDPVQYRSFFTRQGLQYGLPKYHGALALYYNKNLFDEHGVSYPDASWDHARYLEAMQRLTDDRDADDQTDLWGSMVDISWERIQVHVNAWGGHFVDPENPSNSLMDEQPALQALEWLRARMWDDKVMATPLDVNKLGTRQAFSGGRVAMVEDGSWALRDILVEASFRIGVAAFPAGPARRATLATTDGFGMYAGTKHPDAAWELLKFLISKEYGLAMAKAHFLQPARASLVEDWVRYIRGEFPEQTKEMDIAAFADGHLKGYSVVAEVFSNQGGAKRVAYDAWDRILTLGQAPVDLIRDASQQIEAAQG